VYVRVLLLCVGSCIMRMRVCLVRVLSFVCFVLQSSLYYAQVPSVVCACFFALSSAHPAMWKETAGRTAPPVGP